MAGQTDSKEQEVMKPAYLIILAALLMAACTTVVVVAQNKTNDSKDKPLVKKPIEKVAAP